MIIISITDKQARATIEVLSEKLSEVERISRIRSGDKYDLASCVLDAMKIELNRKK